MGPTQGVFPERSNRSNIELPSISLRERSCYIKLSKIRIVDPKCSSLSLRVNASSSCFLSVSSRHVYKWWSMRSMLLEPLNNALWVLIASAWYLQLPDSPVMVGLALISATMWERQCCGPSEMACQSMGPVWLVLPKKPAILS